MEKVIQLHTLPKGNNNFTIPALQESQEIP
jgi:hypothetical protein